MKFAVHSLTDHMPLSSSLFPSDRDMDGSSGHDAELLFRSYWLYICSISRISDLLYQSNGGDSKRQVCDQETTTRLSTDCHATLTSSIASEQIRTLIERLLLKSDEMKLNGSHALLPIVVLLNCFLEFLGGEPCNLTLDQYVSVLHLSDDALISESGLIS